MYIYIYYLSYVYNYRRDYVAHEYKSKKNRDCEDAENTLEVRVSAEVVERHVPSSS